MAKLQLNINIIPKLAANAIADIKKDITTKLANISKSGINIVDDASIDTSKRKVNSLIEDIKKSITGVKDTKIDIEANDKNVKETFKKIPKDADKAGEDSGKRFGSSFTGAAKKLLAGAAIFGALSIGAGAVKAAAGEFRDFNAQLQNVESLGVKNVDALGKKLNELSKTSVDTTSNLTGALYQAVSAGVSGTQEQLVGFIDQASKVAVAGNATTEDAVNSLTSVLNSYKLEVGQAGKVSDIFFGAIKGGKTDFGQLNASLSNVIPAASAAGIAFEEVAGNIAQMTALGTPTAQATTQLRAAIVELQKPGAELAKVMSGVTVEIDGVQQTLNASNIGQVLKQQGLTTTLQQIEQSAAASGKSLTQVFSSTEAAGAALLLTGENAETANKQLQNIKQGIEEGVSTSAFEAQFKSLDNQLKLVKNNLQAGFNTLFTSLLPVVNNLLQQIIPIIGQLLDGVAPVIEQLASVIGPVLTEVVNLIMPVIDLLANQLAPLVVSILGKIATLIAPIGALLAPLFDTLNAVFQQISPIINELVDVLVNGLSQALQSLTPLVSVLAKSMGGVLGEVLATVLTIVVELVSNNLTLINTLLNLLQVITPLVELVLNLASSLITLGLKAFKPLIGIVSSVVKVISQLVGALVDSVVAVGKFLGLIEKAKPQAPFKKVSESAVETTKEVQAMNKELENPAPAVTAQKITTSTKATGKAHKDNTKYAVEYFNTLKEGQSEALKMQVIEDEITRIREERAKSSKDELVEQQRELDALLDRRNKLVKSLADGFVIDDKGNKIKITAEERVDLTEMLANLNTELRFAAKDIEKLEVQIEVDDRKAARETQLTIAELQRERLEIEVDMGIRPKTDLLAAYQKDLEKLNIAIAGVEGVEQEKLQNEKLKKLQQIYRIQEELNKEAADNAALLYSQSFNAVVDSFANNLNNAFKSVQPNTERIDAIKEEIAALDELKTETLKNYQQGIISAADFNQKIYEIERDRVKKSEELNQKQFNSFKIFSDGLGAAFTSLSVEYNSMIEGNVKALSELRSKEIEYQRVFAAGEDIPEDVAKAHEKYDEQVQLGLQNIKVAAASTFANLLVTGKLTVKSFANLALEALDNVFNIYIAEIFGTAVAQLGPIFGPIAAIGLIATFKGLVAVAKSSVGGAYKGVFNLSESNKGKPGPGDDIPMMVKRGESVVTAESSKRNPFIKYNITQKMDEDEYFMKFKLPQFLAKHKIEMPSLKVGLLPLSFDNKGISEANEAAKYLQMIDEKYRKIDKEKLSIAVQRDKEATRMNNELINQVKILHQDNQILHADNKEMKEEMKKLNRDFRSKQDVNVKGKFTVTGEDLEAAIIEKNRRSVR